MPGIDSSSRLRGRRVGCRVEPVRHRRDPAQRVGPPLFQAEPVERPVRSGGDRGRVGRQHQARRTARAPVRRSAGRCRGRRGTPPGRSPSASGSSGTRCANTRPVAVRRRPGCAWYACAYHLVARSAIVGEPGDVVAEPGHRVGPVEHPGGAGAVAGRGQLRHRSGRGAAWPGRPGCGPPTTRSRPPTRAHGSWRFIASGPSVPAKS